MQILIDGYNLLHAVGFLGDLSTPGNLEKARLRLLTKLSEYLTPEQRKATCVVFDSRRQKRDDDQPIERCGMRVEFAYDFNDADEMIEQLIKRHASPQKLLVVSADHRIQRAAKARRCRYVDSDDWIGLLESGENRRGQKNKPIKNQPSKNKRQKTKAEEKPAGNDSSDWLAFFDVEENELIAEERLGSNKTLPDASSEIETQAKEDQPFDDVDYGEYDIFPEGFGDDVEELK